MSPEEKDQKIERLEQENQALRERIAELERSLGLLLPNKFKTASQRWTQKGE
jgi:hypothetical protein